MGRLESDMPATWSFPPQGSFLVLAILLALLGFMSFVSSLVASRRRKPYASVVGGMTAMMLFVVSLLFGAVSVGLRDYEVLTRETVAVVVTTIPTGDQVFEAHFQYPDGREQTFELAGDQLYVDARILKWKSIANFFGLHTQYALDRVGGRYKQLKHERTRRRTVHPLGKESTINLFEWRRRWHRLSPLFDAEYGSGTWVDASSPGRFEVRVSATGLLMRPIAHSEALAAPGG